MMPSMGDNQPGRDAVAGGDTGLHFYHANAEPLSSPKLRAASLASRRTGAAILLPTENGRMEVFLSIGEITVAEHERLLCDAEQMRSIREVRFSSGGKLVSPDSVQQLDAGQGGLYLPLVSGHQLNGLLYVGLEDPRALELPKLDFETRCDLSAQWLSLLGAVLSLGEQHRTPLSQSSEGMAGMVGSCPEMQRVFADIRRCAGSKAHVLVVGETGTGKELAARALVAHSSRAKQPLVSLNCAAMQESLLMSELFGHERGAFTGAIKQQRGKFEQANGGTLFLDEVGELSLNAQAALLRVLEEKIVTRTGGTTPIYCDVRVISATHRDLPEMVRAGRFREDLYYRLKALRIDLPPLRARGRDIHDIADALLRKLAAHEEMTQQGFTVEARAALVREAWRGNVRELENTLLNALLKTAGHRAIDRADLGLSERHFELSEPSLLRFLQWFMRRLEQACPGTDRTSWEDAVLTALTRRDGRGAGRAFDALPLLRAKLDVPPEGRGDANRLSRKEAKAFMAVIMDPLDGAFSVEALATSAATFLQGSATEVEGLVSRARQKRHASQPAGPQNTTAVPSGIADVIKKGTTK
jgi:transcriptional regulator with GAF, ATPase, and Fis domain